MRKNSDIKADIVRCKDCIHKPVLDVVRRVRPIICFPDEVCPCACDDPWYDYMPDDDWFCKAGESND